MESFLDRFYAVVDEALDDPHTSKRQSKASKLRAFYNTEKTIWERMLTASVDTVIGFTRIAVAVQNDKEFYTLPGNFRRFLAFELWSDSGNYFLRKLGTVPYWDPGPGIVLLDGQQGFIIKPKPSLSEQESWRLEYQKGPLRIHQGTAADMGEMSIEFATPTADDGELVLVDDYYRTALVHIYDAATGVGQTREVTDFNASSRWATLRHAWDPIPTGTVKYEVRPLIPPDYDEIYALEVAIKIGQRRRLRGIRDLIQQQSVLWKGARSYFMDAVADRAPSRTLPPAAVEVDPYQGS